MEHLSVRITYVGYGDFHHYAGMKQLYHFAQEVRRQGHAAQILIAGSTETVISMEEPPEAEIVEMAFTGPLLARRVRQQVLAFEPEILHIWTPRHVPALAGWQLHRSTGVPLVMDHEDDEDYHVCSLRQATMARWQHGARRFAAPVALLRDALWPWVMPVRSDGAVSRMAKEPVTYRQVTRAASAHTAISPNLTAWAKSQWPGVPVHLLYPGANLQLFGPHVTADGLQEELGLNNRQVLVYSGAMNTEIFFWFMRVLAGVVGRFPKAVLLLVGDDGFRVEAKRVATGMGLQNHYRLVGRVPYSQVPRFLSLADVLLQHPLDLGNNLRLPAKLPEYLSIGRAVVTYAQGIGESLEDHVQVRKLYTSEPEEAVDAVCQLLDDPSQRAALGYAARQLACQRFDWSENGRRLITIYRDLLGPQV